MLKVVSPHNLRRINKWQKIACPENGNTTEINKENLKPSTLASGKRSCPFGTNRQNKKQAISLPNQENRDPKILALRNNRKTKKRSTPFRSDQPSKIRSVPLPRAVKPKGEAKTTRTMRAETKKSGHYSKKTYINREEEGGRTIIVIAPGLRPDFHTPVKATNHVETITGSTPPAEVPSPNGTSSFSHFQTVRFLSPTTNKRKFLGAFYASPGQRREETFLIGVTEYNELIALNPNALREKFPNMPASPSNGIKEHTIFTTPDILEEWGKKDRKNPLEYDSNIKVMKVSAGNYATACGYLDTKSTRRGKKNISDFEWLHLGDFSGGGGENGPDKSGNLVVGTRGFNTVMMTWEKFSKWLPTDNGASIVIRNVKAELIPGTHIATSITYGVTWFKRNPHDDDPEKTTKYTNKLKAFINVPEINAILHNPEIEKPFEDELFLTLTKDRPIEKWMQHADLKALLNVDKIAFESLLRQFDIYSNPLFTCKGNLAFSGNPLEYDPPYGIEDRYFSELSKVVEKEYKKNPRKGRVLLPFEKIPASLAKVKAPQTSRQPSETPYKPNTVSQTKSSFFQTSSTPCRAEVPSPAKLKAARKGLVF